MAVVARSGKFWTGKLRQFWLGVERNVAEGI